MKKLFVSLPMRGRTDEEISRDIQKLKEIAEIYFEEKLEVLESHKEPDTYEGNISLHCLGRSLQYLSQADYYIGYANPKARGCIIENEVLELYDTENRIKRLYIE